MSRPARTIALVACASRKRTHPAPAADLYVSDLFRKARAFAERRANAWFVLSAQHGLVEPGDVLEPYDLTLNAMGVAERRSWAERVWTRLEPLVEPGDTVIFLAGARYREDLVARLAASGVRVEIPMEGLAIGKQLAWLSSDRSAHTTTMPHSATLEAFYDVLARLAKIHGAGTLRTMARRRDLPPRGVYFFLDRSEPRSSKPGRPRVVRVGTHALMSGSSSTLVGRLRQHLGSGSGAGNHRGSIFRLHVGAALMARDGLEVPTWGVTKASPGAIDRDRELEVEQMVSRYIGELDVVVLPVLDEPAPESLRGYVERSAIGLLSTIGREVDPPSEAWLGRHAARTPIRESGLWNVRHIGDRVDGDFVARFADLVHDRGTQPDEAAARPRSAGARSKPRGSPHGSTSTLWRAG